MRERKREKERGRERGRGKEREESLVCLACACGGKGGACISKPSMELMRIFGKLHVLTVVMYFVATRKYPDSAGALRKCQAA